MAARQTSTAVLSLSESVSSNFCSRGQADATKDTLAKELAQLTIVPPRAPSLPPARATSAASPFSTPEPDLVQQLQERPLQSRPAKATLSLHTSLTIEPGLVNAPTPLATSGAKATWSESASGLLPSGAYTSSYPGGLSPPANALIPPHGVRALCGKRAKMEDTYNVQTNFANVQLSSADSDFQNKLPARIASQVGEQLEQQTSPPTSLPLSPNSTCVPSLSTSEGDASVGGSSESSDNGSCCDTLHFFGVYDGHGGAEAAQHCANRLHFHLSTALVQVAGTTATIHTNNAFCSTSDTNRTGVQCQAEWTLCQECDMSSAHEGGITEHASAAVDRMFSSATDVKADSPSVHPDGTATHAVSLESSSTDSDSSSSEPSSATCVSDALEAALRTAFIKTDEEFAEDGSSAMVGSTAVVALVGSKKLWIANCGDSRAVLCRSSKAIQVTDDHKPEREDEAARVEAAGGQVLYWNGHRVMGVLAMSRAIGDHGLRPYVIPEPEITVLSRVCDDDFLLLASDGLWDVMTNQEAISLAMRCLVRSCEKGTSRKAALRVVATVLTRAAVDRGSKDNVTVVIIDLKTPQPTSSDGKQESLATPCDGCLPSPMPTSCNEICPPTPMPSTAGNQRLVSQATIMFGREACVREEGSSRLENHTQPSRTTCGSCHGHSFACCQQVQMRHQLMPAE